ncbi:hypothetical protein BA897_03040 [Spiribacter roseus]|nr:hypothetical protein BA897_03040 [Spiribacter roseus]
MTFLYRCKTVLQIKLHGRPFGFISQEGFQRSELGLAQGQGSCLILQPYVANCQLVLAALTSDPHRKERSLFVGDLHVDSEASDAIRIPIRNQLTSPLDGLGRTGVRLIFITDISVQAGRILTGHSHTAESIGLYTHIILQPVG